MQKRKSKSKDGETGKQVILTLLTVVEANKKLGHAFDKMEKMTLQSALSTYGSSKRAKSSSVTAGNQSDESGVFLCGITLT